MSAKAERKTEPMDQVKFLVTCIKHAANGRPDFDAVARELDIVSKAAAQKRYERMLKANNVTPSKATPSKPTANEEKNPKAPARKRKPAAGASTPKSKKAKKNESDEDAKPACGAKKEEEDEKESASSGISDAPASPSDQDE